MENHLIKIYFPSPTEFISEKLKNPTDTIQFSNSRNHEIAEKLDLSLKEYELSSFGIDEIFSLKFINFLNYGPPPDQTGPTYLRVRVSLCAPSVRVVLAISPYSTRSYHLPTL